MNKHWAALLLAITATQAIAGDKEYTVKACEVLVGPYFRTNDCNNCKEIEGAKKSFKVSQQLNSVMQISTKSDGSTHSSVIENCKIFDENNFQCLTKKEATYLKNFFDLGMIDKLVVSNGKWESTFLTGGYYAGKYGSDLKKGEKITKEGEFDIFVCGYEIKNVFNFFK
jgi:hypothetical protein